MEQRRRGPPALEPVLESDNNSGATQLTTQPSVRYKPHKYGSVEMKESDEAKAGQCIMCVKQPLRYFGKLRDRYVKAMNEMAVGGDFTGLAGYHTGADIASQDGSNSLERCRSVKERREEEKLQQEELAAMMSSIRSKSQTHHRLLTSHVHPS